jgi:hypothetical protein
MRNGKDTPNWPLPRETGEGDREAVEGAIRRTEIRPPSARAIARGASPASGGGTASHLPLVGRACPALVAGSKNATHFSGGGPSFVTDTDPHPDRFALRPPRKGEVSDITNTITGGTQQ